MTNLTTRGTDFDLNELIEYPTPRPGDSYSDLECSFKETESL